MATKIFRARKNYELINVESLSVKYYSSDQSRMK